MRLSFMQGDIQTIIAKWIKAQWNREVNPEEVFFEINGRAIVAHYIFEDKDNK